MVASLILFGPIVPLIIRALWSAYHRPTVIAGTVCALPALVIALIAARQRARVRSISPDSCLLLHPTLGLVRKAFIRAIRHL